MRRGAGPISPVTVLRNNSLKAEFASFPEQVRTDRALFEVVTGNIRRIKVLVCLTPTKGPIDMIEEKTKVTNNRGQLLALRNKVGAETPLGYHLSNLDQQLRNWERETDPTAKEHPSRFIARSVAAIERLS
jgi:hypothetical protein